MKVTNKWTQSKEELCSNDIGELTVWGANPTVTSYTNGFQPCLADANSVLPQKIGSQEVPQSAAGAPATPGTVTVTPGTTMAAGALTVLEIGSGLNRVAQALNYTRAGNAQPHLATAAGSIRRTEQRYVFTVGRAATSAAGNNNTFRTRLGYLIKFGQIPHCLLSVNKDLYFGETLILQINWSPLRRVAWSNRSYTYTAETALVSDRTYEYSPASIPQVIIAGGGAFLDANNFAQVKGITLYLAVETNRTLIDSIVRQMSTNGLRLLVPYTYTNKYTSNATISQNVQQRINRAWGRTLLRIYHSVFNLDETSHFAYDNTNVSGAKVNEFYTSLDNDRLQEMNISCVRQEDYMMLKELIKGTSYQSSRHYQDNWSWVDEWTGTSPVHYRKMDIGECGLSLAQERLWQIFLTTANAAYNHYSFFITQKMLSITPSQITIV
jgi:hypothetical protein